MVAVAVAATVVAVLVVVVTVVCTTRGGGGGDGSGSDSGGGGVYQPPAFQVRSGAAVGSFPWVVRISALLYVCPPRV